MQQGFPEGSELAAAQERPQSAVEAETKKHQRGNQEESVPVSGKNMRSSPSLESPRRPHRSQEALQQETRREEVEV